VTTKLSELLAEAQAHLDRIAELTRLPPETQRALEDAEAKVAKAQRAAQGELARANMQLAAIEAQLRRVMQPIWDALGGGD
jgi:hypothetical protein